MNYLSPMKFPYCSSLFLLVSLFSSSFALAASSPTLSDPIQLPKDCEIHVAKTLEKRLQLLQTEHSLPLAEEFLQQDPRFRNFPAISLQSQLEYCPTLKSLDLVLEFLHQVGFSKSRMMAYYKKMIFLQGKEKFQIQLKVREYQIGQEWNREIMTKDLLSDSQLSKAFFSYGTAVLEKEKKIYPNGVVYLGEFLGKHLIAVPYHQLTQAKAGGTKYSCSNFSYIFPGVKENPISAGETLVELPEVDQAICEIILHGKEHKLQGAQWKWETNLQVFAPLLVMGRGSYDPQYRLSFDRSQECKVLGNPKNPQWFQNKGYPGSWRLAMGCDVSHGDSGSAVYFRDSGNLAGFVTTTNPYTLEGYAALALQGQGVLSEEKLYWESSAFVPLTQWKTALEKQAHLPLVQEILKKGE